MPSKSKHRAMTAFLPLAVALMLACDISTSSAPAAAPGVDATTAALQLQGTALALQLTQAAINSQVQLQPPNPPAAAPSANAPAAPAQPPAAPAAPAAGAAGAAPAAGPAPAADIEARIKSAKILVYENMDEYNVGMYAQEALEGLGLKYTQTGSYSGHFMQYLNSGAKFDLIIVDAEGKDKISGEFWDVINTRLTRDKAALIVEVWYLDREANGPISKILSGCGIRYRTNHLEAESIYWWVSDHPVFNEPNTVFPLLNFNQYWGLNNGGDGDKIMQGPGGDATILAGLSSKPSMGEGVMASCYDGRVIFQTFSDHDFRQSDIIPLWQNQIHYTLKNHFLAVGP